MIMSQRALGGQWPAGMRYTETHWMNMEREHGPLGEPANRRKAGIKGYCGYCPGYANHDSDGHDHSADPNVVEGEVVRSHIVGRKAIG